MTSVSSSPLYTGICQSRIATCADDPVAGPHAQLAETTEYGNQQLQESTDSREPFLEIGWLQS
jgi:hypothetical protein